jgi:putative IMPACT (imprinted ancient) family translation regulator
MNLEKRLKYYQKQKSRFLTLFLRYEYSDQEQRFIDTIRRQIDWNNTYIKRIDKTILNTNKKP